MPAQVAVLMAAYNADRTIRAAVDSVLASTIPCDLYIVDDCSRTPVSEFLGTPPGVKHIRLAHNHGLAGALNIGLQYILPLNYKYLARMDADDVSYPHRFATQIAFLEANLEIGLVGSGARFIDDKTGAIVKHYVPPLGPANIRKALFYNNCIVHSSWMIRAEILTGTGPYSVEYPAAEDYEFLRRISSRVILANLADELMDYRISTDGISITRRRRQLLDRLRIQFRYVDPLEWRCWVGMARTLMLFAIPHKVLTIIKAGMVWLTGGQRTITAARNARGFP
jgi:glycosyltransferase involved in cell wall biosynthesis